MTKVAFIGFGEAARAFAEPSDRNGAATAFDVKLLDTTTCEEIERAAVAAGVALAFSAVSAVDGADLIISVVTADRAVAAAEAATMALKPGALFCDLNSVAPDTKRRAAAIVESTGARYADVAVMAPVHPAGRAVPLLVSGRHAAAARAALAAIGFSNAKIVAGEVGAAASIKMIRSVMVKGMEALSAECFIAADAAGVRDEVIASLDASEQPATWATRADYHLDRMMTHGLRRAAEMEEVVRTLDALGTGSVMARATALRQRVIGALGLPANGDLGAKLARLRAPAAAACR